MADKTIEIEAETLEEAREQVKSQIPEGVSVLSEKVISDGKPKTTRAAADTTEAAFVKAQSEIPTNADILEKKELTAPELKVTAVEDFDEQSAKARLQSQIGNTAIIKALRLITSGKQGFLGIGKKPNQYEAEVFQQAVVEIIYKTTAKIYVEVGKEKKTIVTVLREIVIEFGSDDRLTGTQKAQLLDLLRNIYNSNFSEGSIRAALQYPNVRIRSYVEKFLNEVAALN